MASQNRRDYGGYRTQSSGLAFLRGAFIMLVVLILSFGLGFFVLARFMPGSPKLENGQAGVAVATTRGQNDTPAGMTTHVPAPSRSHVQTPKPPPAPPASQSETQGPIIAPSDESQAQQPGSSVQQPGSMDVPTKPNSQTDDSDRPEPKEKPTSRTKSDSKEKVGAEDKPAGREALTPHKSGGTGERSETSSVKPHKTIRKPVGEGTETQKPSGETAHNTESNSPSSTSPRDTPENKTPSATGLYRVQIGAFGTREQAEQVIKEAQAKGFDAIIKVSKKDGQTLYKVQHSAHQSRAEAEKEGQLLSKAGFDVYISNPDK